MSEYFDLNDVHAQKEWRSQIVIGPRPYILAVNHKTQERVRIPLGATINHFDFADPILLSHPKRELDQKISDLKTTINELLSAVANLSHEQGRLTGERERLFPREV